MKHVVSDFRGGLTNLPTGDQAFALECLNFVVQRDGSLLVRDGSDLVFDQLPSGDQRVAWMGKHEGSFFAVSGREVYCWTGTSWVRITPHGLELSVFGYGDADSVVSAALVGRDLVLCLSPAPSDDGKNVPMRLIWDDAAVGGAGWWVALPLGLPPLSLEFDTAVDYCDAKDINASERARIGYEGHVFEDNVYNFGACFYYSITSRGRVRYFYGPLYSWQQAYYVNRTLNGYSRNFYLFASRWWSCAGQPKPGQGGTNWSGCIDFAVMVDDYTYATFMPWGNAGADRYPETLMKVGVFRSKMNSPQLYWFDSRDNDSSSLRVDADSIKGTIYPRTWAFDDEVLGAPPANADDFDYPILTPAPFVDGQVDFECCPPMVSIAECNGFLLGVGVDEVSWVSPILQSGTQYGGWARTITFRPERVRQSVPGLPDIWPRSFYVDLDQAVFAGGGINGLGFAFTQFRAYRLDGSYDQFGSGGLRKKLLGEGSGCSQPASVLRFGQNLFWLGNDGFYVSNGVDVRPISTKMRTAFGARTCKAAAVDPVGRRLFWVLDNGTFVCYPDFASPDGDLCFVEWDGPDFLNSCVLADGLDIYRGRTDGKVVKHGTALGDCGVAFEASYRTPYVVFGDPVAAKSQPRVDVLVNNANSPFTVHLQSYRDNRVGDSYSVPGAINVSSNASCSEGAFVAARGLVPFKRYLRSNDLRCHSRSIRVAMRGPVVDGGEMTLTYQGEVGGYPTFKFSGNRPNDVVVGSLLYLDETLVPLEICAVSTDTISVRANGGYSVGQVAGSWNVYGRIPAGVSLRGIVLHAVGSSDNLQGGES